MQFTDEVDWRVGDFIFAAALILGTGATYELAARTTRSIAYRAAVGAALAAAFLIVWVTGAVGIIGDEDDPANLMYFGVIAIAIVGAVVARLEPDGLARALFATAFAQALVAVIALVGRMGSTGPIWPWDVLGATGFLTALWLVSAWLFQKAALEQGPAGTGPRG
jgi:hypothetical protein